MSGRRDDYLGLDMTDEGKGRLVTREASAVIDPAPNVNTGGVERVKTEYHSDERLLHVDGDGSGDARARLRAAGSDQRRRVRRFLSVVR